MLQRMNYCLARLLASIRVLGFHVKNDKTEEKRTTFLKLELEIFETVNHQHVV